MAALLTSDFPSPGNEAVARELEAMVPRPRIAWIAPGFDASRWEAAQMQFSAYGFRSLTSLTHLEVAGGRLAGFDVAYLSGGAPLAFYQSLVASGAPESLQMFTRRGGLLVGASGGAMLLTANLSIYRLREVAAGQVLSERDRHPGLGIVDVEIVPHALAAVPAVPSSLLEAYAAQVATDIWLLSDGSALVDDDGRRRPIGNAQPYLRTAAPSSLRP